MDTYQVKDVFTPASPARLTFIERDNVNKRIVRALRTIGTQLIIYGYSGSGKTTLVENKLAQTYEHHVRTNCMKGMTYEAILLDAFDQLSPYYIDEFKDSEKIKISSQLSTSYSLIKTQISTDIEATSEEKKSRILPPQLTAQSLARFMGAVKGCWILEDFHKVDKSEKEKLAQLMKVFMDISSEYEDLKIIYVGAVETAREVVQLDKEMRRRVSEIHVPLMTQEEIIQIMKKGLLLLNIGVKDRNVAIDLHNHCSGLPAICHKLCSLMCEDLNVYQTVEEDQSDDPYDYDEGENDMELSYESDDEIRENVLNNSYISSPFENIYSKKTPLKNEDVESNIEFLNRRYDVDGALVKASNSKPIPKIEYQFAKIRSSSGINFEYENLQYALTEYLEDESDTIKCAFDRAFKKADSENIIEALSECSREGGSFKEIINNLREIAPAYNEDRVKKILYDLSLEKYGGLLRVSNDSGIYTFSEPFFRTFAIAYFHNKAEFGSGITDKELMQVFNNAFGYIKKQITL